MNVSETLKNLTFNTTNGMFFGAGLTTGARQFYGHIFTALPSELEVAATAGAVTFAAIQAVGTIAMSILKSVPGVKKFYTSYADENKYPFRNLALRSAIIAGISGAAAYYVTPLQDLLTPQTQLISFVVANVAVAIFGETVKSYVKAEEPKKTKS